MAEPCSPPIRVVYCSKSFQVGGGIARMDHYHHMFLDRTLFDPVFVVTDEPGEGQKAYEGAAPYVFTGIENRFARLMEIFSTADMVVFSDVFSPIICEAAIASRVPAIVEVAHDIATGRMYDEIDVTICVSEAARKVQPVPEKTAVIHNGINLPEFPFRATSKDNGGKIIILQAGSRGKAEINLDALADEIAAINPSVGIWMAGADQTLPSTERVKFLGVQNDIASLYHKADLLFLYSKREAFGLVVAEAMACGLLPVVSDNGGPAEIVSNGVDGWIGPAGNRSEAIAMIRKALAIHGTDEWEKMRTAARAKVERSFSIERCVREYEIIFARIVSGKGRRATPGPRSAPVPPEVSIEEAVFHMQRGDWNRAVEMLRSMDERPAPVRVKLCAWALEKFAKQAVARGDLSTADLCYRKLYNSGFRDIPWMKDWLSVLPSGAGKEPLLKELIAMNPADADLYMLLAEFYMESGKSRLAVSALNDGAQKCPGSPELAQIRDMLAEKLGGAGHDQ
ncbi:MAG: glycosyltransferase [Nitrospinae bacterium]|nr:glycosyltransferase [Nitrospinota bacterium]